MDSFGTLIVKARMSKRVSVKELIKRMNGDISAAYVTKIEFYGEIPSPTTVFKLCKALGLDAEILLNVAKKEKIEEYKDVLDVKYSIARIALQFEEEIEHGEPV